MELSILGASRAGPAAGLESFPVSPLSPKLPKPTPQPVCVRRAGRRSEVRSVEDERSPWGHKTVGHNWALMHARFIGSVCEHLKCAAYFLSILQAPVKWGGFDYDPSFTDAGIEAQRDRISDLTKVTELASSRAGIQTPAVWLQALSSARLWICTYTCPPISLERESYTGVHSCVSARVHAPWPSFFVV